MVLNIFPRQKAPPEAPPAPEPEPLPEPSPEALQDPPKRTRRGTRGGRGRSRASEKATATEAADIETTETAAADEPETVAEEAPPEPPATTRRRSRKTAAAAEEPQPEAEAAPAEAEAEPRPTRSRSRQPKPAAEPPPAPDHTAAILQALEQQSRQFEQLLRAQEELAKKLSAPPPPAPVQQTPVQLPRVGVFVDAANIELACDRLRARFDWGKVLALLTKDRQLVRALAYSPVHDDPAVSMETQRFAEPFLDKGFKIVTKPLKRFSDGSIKANTDIEMALDVVSMLERLDIVCIVSGDGDFQPLVEYVQRRGVRCEVAAIGSSTASNLRNAADAYIDLQQRLKEIKA